MFRFIVDKNILFGIFAFQTGFITREALVAALTKWVGDKSKPMNQILREQDAVAADVLPLLEGLVEKHLALHGQDASRSLEAISSLAHDVLDELRRIDDPDVRQSLAGTSGEATIDLVPDTTVAVGASTSRGLRFRILRPHAKGGLGLVYVARDEELNREVALKEIRGQHADHAENRTRFMLEAEITGGLEHPGIVPVYGLGQYGDGRPFYAMRFIRGDNLKDAIAKFHADARPWREKILELRELLERFIDVCNAIQYAHDRGILHRDLKPGNIMLGKYGETLVVDWGLAKPMGTADPNRPSLSEESRLQPASASGSAATLQGSAVGTPQYMSPEQAAGRLNELGPATDIYSLGATLYNLLTAKTPYEFHRDNAGKPDIAGLLLQVQEGKCPPPRHHNRDISPPLEAICLKAMALNPKDRYNAPRELIDDVKHWLADEPVSAWPEPWTIKARRWMARHRMLVTGIAAAIIVGMLSLAAATLLLAERNAVIEKQNNDLQDANDAIRAESREKERQRLIAVAEHRKAEDRLDQSVETLKLFAIDAREFCDDAMVPGESKQKLFDVLLRQLETQAAVGFKDFNEDKVRARIFLYETVALTQLELGRTVAAANTLKQSLALADQWLAVRPDDPGALGRRAAALYLSGVALESDPNHKLAVSYFNEALAIRQKLLGNEKVERFTPAKTITDLADSLDALERWEESIKLRRQAYEVIARRIANAQNKKDDAYGYINALNWTYQKAAKKTDNYAKKKEYLDQANTTSAELFKLRKDGRMALVRWAKNLHLYGRTEYRQSQAAAEAGDQAMARIHLAEAQKQFAKYADIAQRLATSRDLLTHRQVLAQAWYEQGRIEKEAGKETLAEQYWTQSLHLRDELIRDYRNTYDNLVGSERLLVLAQLGKHAEATKSADMLRLKHGEKTMLYMLARIYSVSSAAVAMDKTLRESYRTKALVNLEESITSGFDDWASVRHEPDLAHLRDDSRYKKLLQQSKK